MDRFRIDSHKASYHPERAGIVERYAKEPENDEAFDDYRQMQPLYIEVAPVGACNHRCTFCSVDYIGYKSIFLDPRVYAASFEGLKTKYPVKAVMFAGEGEPLLHNQISEFLEINKRSAIDSAFTTNGTLLGKGRYESILPLTSWIKVSCNAGTKESYAEIHRAPQEHFNRVWENLEGAANFIKEHKLSTKLGCQTLLLPENSNEIKDLATRAKESGLDYIVVKPYSQHLLSGNTKHKYIDYSKYLRMGEELAELNDERFDVIFRINTIKSWIAGKHEYCRCYSTPSMWGYIMANGDVYTCSAFLLDDRFKLGNIYEQSFAGIWSSEKRMRHAKYVMQEHNIEECRINCRMNGVNKYLADLIDNERIEHKNFI